jgi:hypothetical protein
VKRFPLFNRLSEVPRAGMAMLVFLERKTSNGYMSPYEGTLCPLQFESLQNRIIDIERIRRQITGSAPLRELNKSLWAKKGTDDSQPVMKAFHDAPPFESRFLAVR